MSIILADVGGVQVGLSPGSEQRKLQLVAEAIKVTAVTDAASQSLAALAARNITAELKAVEKARTEIKAPVLRLEKKIDTIAKDYCSSLILEKDRIGKLVDGFQEKERARVAEEERIRAEAARKLQEAADAAKREVDRLVAEQAAKAAALEAERLKAQESAKPGEEIVQPVTPELTDEEIVAANLALSAQDEAEELAAAAQMAVQAPAPVVAKSEGMVSQKRMKYEITDPLKVYAKHPHFFKLEEKKSIINDTIYVGFECDGMRVWEETKSGFRA